MDNDNKGNKHICKNCSTKFYDLNKQEIICPKCGMKKADQNLKKVSKEQTIKSEDVEEVDNIVEDELNDDISFDDELDEDKNSNVIDIE